MEISKTIRERRSVRRFKKAPVPYELVISLLNQAANLYETEGNPKWRCIYIDTPESQQRLADSMLAKVTENSFGKFIPGKLIDLITKRATDIPVNLVFIANSADNQRQSDENYAAVCSIMQNFQLLGWEHGLGMLWYTEPLITSKTFYKQIGLQDGERFAGILNVGYIEKTPRARKRTPAEQNWLAMHANDRQHSENLSASSQSVLEVLNEAVWAPNDELREPWRFIYVTGDEAANKLQSAGGHAAPALLLVVAKEEADPHKREEDYAAVCCLIQNFQLLAKSRPWRARRLIPEWIYDREQCKPFGIRPQERIVAVLELGGDDQNVNSTSTLPVLDIIHL